MSDKLDFVENRTVTLAISTTQLTGRALSAAIRKVLEAAMVIKHLIQRLMIPP